jgi:hypothetical protein
MGVNPQRVPTNAILFNFNRFSSPQLLHQCPPHTTPRPARHFASQTRLRAPSDSVEKLAVDAETNTAKYINYLKSQKLPLPTHETDPVYDFPANTVLPEEIVSARDAAINACQELSLLLGGPARNIIKGASEQFMGVALRFVCRHDIPTKVPLHGTISASELAEQCSIDRDDLLRMIRCAQAWHLFREPTKGQIAHTAASRKLKEDDRFRAWITNATDQVWSSVPHVVDTMSRWPGSEDAAKSPWSSAHGVDESAFSYWDKHPEIAAPFIAGMAYWNTAPGFEAHKVLDQFDFASLPEGARFVDLGGSLGHTCMEVARAHPHIHTIVQDLPTTIDNVPADIIPVELRDRVEFMKHDIFTPQPIHGADVYYFRAVLHDWSDGACVEILRKLIPALKKGARILVTDTCLPQFGETSMMEERRLRSLDITLKVFANAKERDEEDWRRVFEMADPRFAQFKVQLPKGSQRLALISVVWE